MSEYFSNIFATDFCFLFFRIRRSSQNGLIESLENEDCGLTVNEMKQLIPLEQSVGHLFFCKIF